MPIPKPKAGEEKETFVARCMGDAAMVKEYDQKQRAAICYSQWRKVHGGEKLSEDTDMEKVALFTKLGDFVLSNELNDEVKLWRKQVLSYGTWVHPQNKDVSFAITKDVVNEIVNNFNVGFPVESPVVLTHTDDPRMKIGFVKAYIQTDKGLDVVMAVSDSKMNANLSDKVKAPGVSCWLDLDYADKKTGKIVGAVVKHVALVNHPYIEGLGKFEAVASLSEVDDGQKFIPLILSEEVTDGDIKVTKEEAIGFLKESGVDVEKLTKDSEDLAVLHSRIDGGELIAKSDAPTLSEDLQKKAEEVLSLAESDSKDTNGIVQKLLARIAELLDLAPKVTALEQQLSEYKAGENFSDLLGKGLVVPTEKDFVIKLIKSGGTLLSDFVEMRKKTPPVKLGEMGETSNEGNSGGDVKKYIDSEILRHFEAAKAQKLVR